MERNQQIPVGRTLTLSGPFVESLSAEQLEAYVAALAEVSNSALAEDPPAFEKELERRLNSAGVAVAPVELSRIVEHLTGSYTARLRITTDDGRVLFERGGSADPGAMNQRRDPEHPQTPLGG